MKNQPSLTSAKPAELRTKSACKDINTHIIQRTYDYTELVSVPNVAQSSEMAEIVKIETEMAQLSAEVDRMQCARCVSAMRVFCQIQYQFRTLSDDPMAKPPLAH